MGERRRGVRASEKRDPFEAVHDEVKQTISVALRRTRLIWFFGTLSMCLLVFGAAFLYTNNRDSNRATKTDRSICERQEASMERLIDTKKKLRTTDSILAELVTLALIPRPGQPEGPAIDSAREEYKRNLAKLRAQEAELRFNEIFMRREIDAVDCKNLKAEGYPPPQPFPPRRPSKKSP